MSNTNITTILLMIFIPFVFVVLAIPFVKKIATPVGARDIPNARKVHDNHMLRWIYGFW